MYNNARKNKREEKIETTPGIQPALTSKMCGSCAFTH